MNNQELKNKLKVTELYEKTIKPLYIALFDQVKYMVTLSIALQGTGLIVLFSSGNKDYMYAMLWFITGILSVFGFLAVFLMYNMPLHEALSSMTLKNVERVMDKEKKKYLLQQRLLFVFLVAQVSTFVLGIIYAQKSFIG